MALIVRRWADISGQTWEFFRLRRSMHSRQLATALQSASCPAINAVITLAELAGAPGAAEPDRKWQLPGHGHPLDGDVDHISQMVVGFLGLVEVGEDVVLDLHQPGQLLLCVVRLFVVRGGVEPR
jgi:hypothetical protein